MNLLRSAQVMYSVFAILFGIIIQLWTSSMLGEFKTEIYKQYFFVGKFYIFFPLGAFLIIWGVPMVMNYFNGDDLQ